MVVLVVLVVVSFVPVVACHYHKTTTRTTKTITRTTQITARTNTTTRTPSPHENDDPHTSIEGFKGRQLKARMFSHVFKCVCCVLCMLIEGLKACDLFVFVICFSN